MLGWGLLIVDLTVWWSAWAVCGAAAMSASSGLSARAGKIPWKDPLVSFLEVMGLAAAGLEAEARGGVCGDPHIQFP